MNLLLIAVGAISVWLYAAWLDNKKGWNLIGWINGACTNPFQGSKPVSAKFDDKDKTICELRERIQILEKIVTEPEYELNKKINNLA